VFAEQFLRASKFVFADVFDFIRHPLEVFASLARETLAELLQLFGFAAHDR